MEDKNHPISCAVLGLGRIGYDTHFRRLLNDDRFKVVAIADGVPERRQAALGAGVEHVFADAAQLIGRLSEFFNRAGYKRVTARIACSISRASFAGRMSRGGGETACPRSGTGTGAHGFSP